VDQNPKRQGRETIAPKAMAAKMRECAAAAHGEERHYYLWLAREWDGIAVRFDTRRVPPSRALTLDLGRASTSR
jgi:hypothetical protein